MSARLSIEELRPAGERAPSARGRARRPFEGARVLAADLGLRPNDAGGILDLALDGLLACLGPCLGMALVLWLPAQLLPRLLDIPLPTSVTIISQRGLHVFVVVALLLAFLPGAIATGLSVSLVADTLTRRAGRPDAPRAVLGPSLARGLRRAAGVTAILFVADLLGAFLIVCVAPYFQIQWIAWAALPVYVLEEDELTPRGTHPLALVFGFPRRVASAFRRGSRLASGARSFGRWLLVFLTGELFFAGLLRQTGGGLDVPAAHEFLSHSLNLGGTAAEVLLGCVSGLLFALACCVRGALMTAFYLDLCVRREGLDLGIELERLAAARPVQT